MAESATVSINSAPPMPVGVCGLADALGLLSRLAAEILGDAVQTSFALRTPGDERAQVLAGSSETARRLDEVQSSCGRGPACETLSGGGETGGPLPDDRWPELSEVASHLGVLSVWALPVGSAEEPLATLNLYFGRAGISPGGHARRAWLLAQIAGVIIDDARTAARLTHGNQTLQQALETRTVIGQAQGVLMARQGIDATAAFDVLRRASQRSNRKLRDIAADLVAGASRHPAANRPAGGQGSRP